MHQVRVGIINFAKNSVAITSCVQDIIEAVDVDNDGDITREEFVNNAMKSSFIRNLLEEEN